MNLTYRENYWDDPDLKRQFLTFIKSIFNVDMTIWEELGYWDDRFRPFSFYDNGKLISHVCIYSLDMFVNGKRRKVAQVSSVATLEEYRRKGLNLKLSQKAIAWANQEHDFYFLFADTDAYPFYKRVGFRRINEYKIVYPLPGLNPIKGAIKLNMRKEDDRKLAYRIAGEREPVSDVLGFSNKRLFMFRIVYFLKDYIYYLPKFDILILYKRENGVMTIFDIVGKQMPSFGELYPYISDVSDTKVEFLFMTDKMDLDMDESVVIELDNGTHVMGDFPFEGQQFIFPHTCHA
jgi:GNAT superfamily N-acetyltransferase